MSASCLEQVLADKAVRAPLQKFKAVDKVVAQVSKPAGSRASRPAGRWKCACLSNFLDALRMLTSRRFGNRRDSRFGNLGYIAAARCSTALIDVINGSVQTLKANWFRLSTFPFSMVLSAFCLLPSAFPVASSEKPVSHSFLTTGAHTQIIGASGEILWTYPGNTRDGWVLPDGNILLAVSASKEFPGGGVVEITRAGQRVFEWKGTQSEVNTVQWLAKNRLLVTEAGPKPRLLELDRKGKIMVEVPLQCQTTNVHMESRMSRKLRNGNYLVPQLLDKVVREYTPAGKIVWEVNTPHWPFTAIRLPNGNTLINCTYGNVSIEVDKKGRKVWELGNSDLRQPSIKDACGAQRLPNGNTVITSYGAKAGETKLIEVTPGKKVVWAYGNDTPHGIHHFQILDTGGKPVKWPPMR